MGLSEILSENVILEKICSDNIRSGFLVPYQKSCFSVIILEWPKNSNKNDEGFILVFKFPAVT